MYANFNKISSTTKRSYRKNSLSWNIYHSTRRSITVESQRRGGSTRPSLDNESVILEFQICPTKGSGKDYVRGDSAWYFEVDRYASRMSTVWRSNALSPCRPLRAETSPETFLGQGLGTSERLGTLIAEKGHSLSFDSPLSSRSMYTEFVGGYDNVDGVAFPSKVLEFKATSAATIWFRLILFPSLPRRRRYSSRRSKIAGFVNVGILSSNDTDKRDRCGRWEKKNAFVF